VFRCHSSSVVQTQFPSRLPRSTCPLLRRTDRCCRSRDVLTAPLGLAGVVPTLLLFHQPFGFNAILGLIALAGILMRNTLILIGQIKTNQEEGLDSYRAVIEATIQRSRPVVLTALAAVLAFIPLTFSVFWGSTAYTLIGGTAVGTVLTLIFLPALYSIWFGVRPTAVPSDEAEAVLVGSSEKDS